MPLTDKQIELLKGIKDRLQYGDIAKIAELSNKSAVSVSNVLNPETDDFNEDIVDIAVQFLNERKKKLDEQLKTVAGL